jgi:hypothetical protein
MSSRLKLLCSVDPTCLVALWCRSVSPNIVTGAAAAEDRGDIAAAVSGLGIPDLPENRQLGCCCWTWPLATGPLGEGIPKPPVVGVAGVVAAVLDPVESRLCILWCVGELNNIQWDLWFPQWWTLKIVVLYFMTLCSLLGGYQRFGGTYCHHLQDRRNPKYWLPPTRLIAS